MARAKRTGQADIADRLGVSISTVSRALANEAGISEAVRREVQHAARLLGYKNKHPQLQGTLDKRAVALVPVSGAIGSLASFYHGIVEGMRSMAEETGISLDVRLVHEETVSLETVTRQVTKSAANGLILAGIDPSEELVSWAGEAGVSIVLANGTDPLMRVSSVAPANFFGAYMATRRLLDAGHRRIMHYTHRSRPTLVERRRGFDAAIASESDAVGVIVNSSEIDIGDLGNRLLAGQYDITALFCWNDNVAVSMLEELFSPDSGMPADFSIIGFDDLPIADIANPRLSTVRVDREAIGRSAIRLLSQSLDGERAIQQVEIGATLVAGETVRPLLRK